MHYVKLFNINGVDTKQVACIELQGPPNAATEGAVGVLGMDVTSPTHEVYRCVAVNGSVYTWELLSAGMSIISATITGEGGMSKVFSYDTLRIPNNYLIKPGDLILDSEGYLYQVDSIGADDCSTSYCGTHIGGIPSGDKDCTIVVKDGKLQLVTESGSVLSEVEFLTSDEETIYRNPSDGVAQVRAIKTVNDTLLHLFVGTQAEYDNLPEYNKQNLFAIITDDTALERIEESVDEMEAKMDALREDVFSEKFVTNYNSKINFFSEDYLLTTERLNAEGNSNTCGGSTAWLADGAIVRLYNQIVNGDSWINATYWYGVDAGKTYTFSCETDMVARISVVGTSGNIIASSEQSKLNPSVTFTAPSSKVRFRFHTDDTGYTIFTKFLLNEGSAPIEYTPYDGRGAIALNNGTYPNMTVGNVINLRKNLLRVNATSLSIAESGFYVFYVDTGLSTVGDVSIECYIDKSRSTNKSVLLADSTTGVASTYAVLHYSHASESASVRIHSNGSYQQGYLTIKGYISIC